MKAALITSIDVDSSRNKP